MNTYNREQFETLAAVRQHLDAMAAAKKKQLAVKIQNYLSFRGQVDNFLERHFSGICTSQCYSTSLSACCSREGIITFFADVAVNALVSGQRQMNYLLDALRHDNGGPKCVYLSPEGCLWRVKPIVCAMFLCDPAKDQVFHQQPWLFRKWEQLEITRKSFTWPDRPVLFDELETYFLDCGISSPLMYLHNSPGMLRLKNNWRIRKGIKDGIDHGK